jgi:hypothetical protein
MVVNVCGAANAALQTIQFFEGGDGNVGLVGFIGKSSLRLLTRTPARRL